MESLPNSLGKEDLVIYGYCMDIQNKKNLKLVSGVHIIGPRTPFGADISETYQDKIYQESCTTKSFILETSGCMEALKNTCKYTNPEIHSLSHIQGCFQNPSQRPFYLLFNVSTHRRAMNSLF